MYWKISKFLLSHENLNMDKLPGFYQFFYSSDFQVVLPSPQGPQRLVDKIAQPLHVLSSPVIHLATQYHYTNSAEPGHRKEQFVLPHQAKHRPCFLQSLSPESCSILLYFLAESLD